MYLYIIAVMQYIFMIPSKCFSCFVSATFFKLHIVIVQIFYNQCRSDVLN